MKVLLDESLPHPLRHELPGHDVFTVDYMGWKGLKNGMLLARASDEGFEVLLTQDRGIQYQQNVSTLPCGILIFNAPSNQMSDIKGVLPAIRLALSNFPRNAIVRLDEPQLPSD